jgi:ribonuclease Z
MLSVQLGGHFELDATLYSDWVIRGRWGGVDDALRGVYQEESETRGRGLTYPADQKDQDN